MEDVILVTAIGDVVASMQLKIDDVLTVVNYQPGTSSQIMSMLNTFDEAYSYKDQKYPLIGMPLPVFIDRNTDGFYGRARIPRIVIATLTQENVPVLDRYLDGGTFKSILYPCYREFLIRLGLSFYNAGSIDPDSFKHTKVDNPGDNKVGRDYIDCIEILNLEFNLQQIKTC